MTSALRNIAMRKERRIDRSLGMYAIFQLTMYIPTSYAEHVRDVLFDFIDAHPLGILVTASPEGGLFATHLPLVVDRAAGDFGMLAGHLARANPHQRHIATGATQGLVIFTGPDAYVSPSWYQAKQEHGRVVPTWNYAAVHASGTLRLVDEPASLRRHLERLTTRHEAGRTPEWKVSDAPGEFIEQQMKAIIGVEISITRLEGKWKMSQNRSDADIDGVVRGLSASNSPTDQVVAALVSARRPAR
jgi:transcriptional regulator